MLARMIGRSLVRQRRRKLLSFAAVVLGIAVTTAVGTVALDVGDRVGRELRSFGANISLAPAADTLPISIGGVDYRPVGSGTFLREADLVKLKKIFWRNNILAFAPFLDLPATIQGKSVVIVGSWFDRDVPVDKSESFRTGLKHLHPDWKMPGEWPSDGAPASCLVGRRLAEALQIGPGQAITVQAPRLSETRSDNAGGKSGATAVLAVSGVLETGGDEDDQIYAPLATVQKLAGLGGKFRRAEVSALTKPQDSFSRSDLTKLSPEEFDRWYCSPYVSSICYQIQQAIPGVEAQPIYRVAETEGKILDRVGILMALLAVAALIAAALAVASMMWAMVLERRSEIGLFKSLGATDRSVGSIMMLEATTLGLAGGLGGYFVGSLMAWRLGVLVFGLPAGMHWVMLPIALVLALIVTLLGSALPIARGLRLPPVTVLHNA